MNLLLIIFGVNVFLLICGITISWIDIHLFGSGLYLALVSIVTVVIVLAFCVVGTDEQTEPTVAKQMWSKSRQTLRRYTFRQPRPRPKSPALSDLEAPPIQLLKPSPDRISQVQFQEPMEINLQIKIQEPSDESDSKEITAEANETNTTEADSKVPLCQCPNPSESLQRL